MELINNIITIFVIFISLVILDYIWLGIITKNFIINQFGSLVKTQGNSLKIVLWAGLIAWAFIAFGSYFFVVNQANTLTQAFLIGALFGLVLYGVYDFTNLTFIHNYPKLFVIVDVIWGSIVCSLISGIGFFVKSIL